MRIIVGASNFTPVYTYFQDVEDNAIPSPWSIRGNIYQIDEDRRLATFNGFQETNHSKEEFCKNGFRWLGVADEMCCCYCKCILGDFECFDDIAAEHAKASPNCPLVKKQDKEEKGLEFYLF